MTQFNLLEFSANTRGEGTKDVNTMLTINFEVIRQLLNIQDELITALEAQYGILPEDGISET